MGVQVNQAGALTAADFTDGQIVPPAEPGAPVAAFVYDGLGHLIRTTRYDAGGEYASEDYYYDGVRRIEEVVDRPDGQGGREEVLREYVYGPGYVDEFVCQIVESGGPAACFYYLQDANNVVAILDDVGAVVAECAAQGAIIGATNRSVPGLNNVLCFAPALIATPDDIDQITDTVDRALTKVFG